MGGLCRLLRRVFPRPGVLCLEGRQAHMQCTLAKKKRDQNEIKPRSKRDQNEITDCPLKMLGYFGPTCAEPAPTSSLTSAPAPINPLPHPLFNSISHLRTPAAQARLLSPAHTRQPNGKHPRSSTPAQRCTGASQIISTPSRAPAQPCKHARLVQVRGKARCRLEPAVAKETSSLKIAKHTVNAPRRIR